LAESQPTVFVGRQKELNQLLDSLCKERRSVTIISSESGMGKSALLSRLYSELKEKKGSTSSSSSSFLVGFYDRNRALVGGSESLIYPFAITLKSLLEWLKDTSDYSDEFRTLLKRTQGALIKTLREEAPNILVALVDDVAKKFGFKETLEVVKKFYKNFKEEKTSIALAEQYVADNQQEAIIAYMTILESLADEFPNRRFVVIFDQFETARKVSIDFLINFVARMPSKNFHVIVSFKVEERAWSDKVARELYEYARGHLTDLGARNITLEGLSAEEIGEWIKAVRKVELCPKDLQIIRERSAGFPFLLNDWITSPSRKLDYDEIDRDRYCELVRQRFRRLSREDEKIKLNRLSILEYPLETEQMARFLETDLERLQLFLDLVISIGIFEQRGEYVWFKHELAQYCISNSILPQIKKTVHKYAADFYLGQAKTTVSSSDMEEEEEEEEEEGWIALKTTLISCAYHLHEAGQYKESIRFNSTVAGYASRIGELDLAERCYLRAIDDFAALGDDESKMDLLFDLTTNVYLTWGRYDESIRTYKQLFEYYSRKGDQHGIARTLHQLGIIDENRGQYDAALEKYNESLEIAKKIEDQKGIAVNVHELGNIYHRIGQYDAALEKYNESLEIAKKIEDQKGIAETLHQLGMTHQSMGQYDAALEKYNESLEIAKKIRNQESMASTLHQLGRIRQSMGQYDAALEKYNESLEISKKIGDQSGIAKTLGQKGVLLANIENYKDAIDYLYAAYNIFDKLKLDPQKQITLESIEKIKNKIGEQEFNTLIQSSSSGERDVPK
jgi:tetratricopeptide (TPR) repeat protein